jgi:hypothetical protein
MLFTVSTMHTRVISNSNVGWQRPHDGSRIHAAPAGLDDEVLSFVAAGRDFGPHRLKGRIWARRHVYALDCAAIIAGLPDDPRKFTLVNPGRHRGLGTCRRRANRDERYAQCWDRARQGRSSQYAQWLPTMRPTMQAGKKEISRTFTRFTIGEKLP